MNNQQSNNMLSPEQRDQIYRDRSVRTAITRQSHLMIFNIYFSEYVKNPTARFQKEFFAITEDQNIKLSVIVAFRGSGKSTIMTLSYPLWAILGEQKKKFVLILSQTQRQSRQHLLNIKRELENNDLLKSDLGPFREERDEWGSLSLVIPNYDAKIMAASTEQSVRGLRHGATRPDLIICDDIEDLDSVKTKEGRDKTQQWLTGDVIPSGDQTTRVVIVGNLLHEDSVLMRIKQGIEEKKLDGIFRQYPLVDENGIIAWTGKYQDQAAIEALERTIGNEASWHREYLLHIISDAERVVHPEWIQYYDVLPKDRKTLFYVAIGIDLAISKKQTADYTAMVSGWVCHDKNFRPMVYILPNPVNQRLTFPETVEKVKWLCKTVDPGHTAQIFVEQTAYQQAFPQQMEQEGFRVEGINFGGMDKRSRIALTTHMIKNGQILFPEKGCEDLIRGLTHFGMEKHDDLADAFTTLILKVIDDKLGGVPLFFVLGSSDNDKWSQLYHSDNLPPLFHSR